MVCTCGSKNSLETNRNLMELDVARMARRPVWVEPGGQGRKRDMRSSSTGLAGYAQNLGNCGRALTMR